MKGNIGKLNSDHEKLLKSSLQWIERMKDSEDQVFDTLLNMETWLKVRRLS